MPSGPTVTTMHPSPFDLERALLYTRRRGIATVRIVQCGMSLKERSHSNEGEPESEIRFQRGMSLQAKCRMLRMIEYSHELGAADPLASSRDAGVCDGQRPQLLVGTGRESVYGFIERVLKGQHYSRLSKGQKGIVRRFLAKVTALSRAQMTRLMLRWIEVRRIERKPTRRPSFPRL